MESLETVEFAKIVLQIAEKARVPVGPQRAFFQSPFEKLPAIVGRIQQLWLQCAEIP